MAPWAAFLSWRGSHAPRHGGARDLSAPLFPGPCCQTFPYSTDLGRRASPRALGLLTREWRVMSQVSCSLDHVGLLGSTSTSHLVLNQRGETVARKKGNAPDGGDSAGPRLTGDCGKTLPEVPLPPAPLCMGCGHTPSRMESGRGARPLLGPNCGHAGASAPSALCTSFLHLSWVLTSDFRPGLHHLQPCLPAHNPYYLVLTPAGQSSSSLSVLLQ